MGDEQLAFIARELIEAVRQNVTIDWTVKQSARAKIRIVVNRILRRYGYPPDLQEAATNTPAGAGGAIGGELGGVITVVQSLGSAQVNA